jgi:hypothetical protein
MNAILKILLQRRTTPIYAKIQGLYAILVMVNGARADPLANWTLRPTPTSQLLTSVAFGATNFVAVGYGATILTSPDGAAWTSRTSANALNLYGVTYGKGLWVAVGATIISSSDGMNWSQRTTATGLSLEIVVLVNGQFIAVGDQGQMYVSSDGINWSARNSGTTASLYGLTYANGTYVVTGAGGLILTSSDAVSWTSQNSGTTQDLNSVGYAGGLFVADGLNGVILTSSNATTWSPQNSNVGLGLAVSAYGAGNWVIPGGGFFIFGDANLILTSPDAVNWTDRNTLPTSAALICAAYGRGTFVVVGDQGAILQSDPVVSSPAIVSQPLSQSVFCHSNANFAVIASGTPPLSYQWRRNGSFIAGATTNSYSVTPLTCQMPDSYTVVITNAGGAVTSAVAALVVTDSMPPTIVCPSNMVLATTPGQCSATANYTVTATDNCAVVSLVVSPPSGSAFPKGTNVVTCTAIDCGGNSNICAFTVTVLDQQAPTIICLSNRTVACNTTNGAQVFFTPTAMDNCDGVLPVLSTPPSGSIFPPGTNAVTCTATDRSGNSNTCTFSIIVREHPPQLSMVQDGANFVLSWPQSCATYVVEENLSLDPSQGWIPLTNSSALPNGTNFELTVSFDADSRFFRLRRQ